MLGNGPFRRLRRELDRSSPGNTGWSLDVACRIRHLRVGLTDDGDVVAERDNLRRRRNPFCHVATARPCSSAGIRECAQGVHALKKGSAPDP